MPIQTAQDQFTHELADLADAEHQFLKGQQELLKQATDAKLQEMLTQHIEQTEQHITNLERVFQLLKIEPEREPCAGAHGIVTEARKTVKEAGTDAIRDCLIGSAALRVEHYEIAGYRSLLVGAKQMEQQEIVDLLDANLDQEEQTARKIERSAPRLLKQAM